MKQLATALTCALMCAVTITGCTVAAASEQAVDKPHVEFNYVCDWNKTEGPQGAVRVMAEQAEREAAEQAERDAQQAAEAAEAEWEAETYYYEPYVASQPSETRGNPDGLNSFDGVYSFNDKTEKFYPESAGRHVNTDQWHEDEQGFFRTDEGYYVVASDEYEPGTVIDTSQGKAQVLDCGAGEGVVDFYVNW